MRRPDEERNGGVVEVFSAARGTRLRSYDYNEGEYLAILPLHDVDGDGAADYLLSDARASRGLESIASLRVISGVSGEDLVARPWSELGGWAPVFGAFDVVGSESVGKMKPLILIGSALFDPATLEPERYLNWKPLARSGEEHTFWIDWGSDGISEHVCFGRKGVVVRSSKDGSVVHRVGLKSRRDRTRGMVRADWRWDMGGPFHAALIESQIVFDGPGDAEIGSVRIANGKPGFRQRVAGPQVPLLHGFVPVRDVDNDGVTDLYSFCRRWDRQVRGMRHEFLLFSGTSGEQLDF